MPDRQTDRQKTHTHTHTHTHTQRERERETERQRERERERDLLPEVARLLRVTPTRVAVTAPSNKCLFMK